MTVAPHDFRDALGRFAAGVAVVTAVDAAGRRDGVTISSFSSVSLDPPLVLFSLGRDTIGRAVFHAARHFAVNILQEGQEDLSARFADPDREKWTGLELDLGAGGCPILKDALVVLECTVEARREGGDHDIFIGRVIDLRFDLEGRPLLYYRGAYRRLAGG